MSLRALLALSVFAAALPAAGKEKEKLLVLDLTAGSAVDLQVAAGMTEAVAIAAARSGDYEVVSSREIQALLGVERQRQLLGCTETHCMTEIGSALGARYLLRGSVGKLGASYQLALQLVDTIKGETLNRGARLAPSLEVLRARIPYVVAAAAGLPPPPGPSKVPAWASLSAGGALALAGGVVGALSLVEEDALRREQVRGVPGTLGTRDSYSEARDRLVLQKSGALGALVLGAGAVVLGVMLMPDDPGRSDFVLRLGPGSVSIAGVFQ